MSDKEREIALFNLGKSLVELLGEEQAIADLTMLLERHPEMFSNEKEISDLIKKVVTEPEIIINNPTPRSEKDYIAGKKLNDKKMGEVGVRNDSGTNVIFHANEKRLKNLDLMSKKDIVIDGRDAHTPYTQAQSLDGRLVQKNISSITNENIIPKSESKNQPKTPIDFQAKLKEFTQKQAQEKNPSKEKERGR